MFLGAAPFPRLPTFVESTSPASGQDQRLCFDILARLFALPENATPMLSAPCALFHENTGGGVPPLIADRPGSKHNRAMRQPSDTDWVIAQAKALGFDLCGIAPAEGWDELAHRDEWLERGHAGEMRYLHDARRADPARVLPEARSAIVCALNYNTRQPLSTEAVAAIPQSGTAAGDSARAAESGSGAAAVSGPRAWISRYAWGDDYHTVLGEKLEKLASAMTEQFGDEFSVRTYVDTGPVSERIAARHAGLGWLAKNTCLINEEMGSWLFLGVVLTSLDLAPSISHRGLPFVAQGKQVQSAPVPRNDAARTPSSDPVPALPADLCGQCTLCLDACPTGALVEPYVLDARRCISYLTIELRGSIPEEFRAAMGWHVVGCDICQDVCPWNRQAPVTDEAAFAPREKLVAPELDWLLSFTEDDFRRIFRGSAVRRTKWRGLVRNACVAAGNALRQAAVARGASDAVAPGKGVSEMPRLRARLAELAASSDALIAEHAQWALAQIAGASGHGGDRPRPGQNSAHPPGG